MADAATGETATNAEREQLDQRQQAQLRSPNPELRPTSLKGLNWQEAQSAFFVAEAGVVIVEFADNAAVVISGNTHKAVHAVAARGILQTLKVKQVPSKIMTPLGADWEEMLRSVVSITEESEVEAVIEFLTGKNMSLEDFGVTGASVWSRDVLVIEELTAAIRRPMLEDEFEFTAEQLEDIGRVCAAGLLFNSTGLLAQQIGLAGEAVTTMNQAVHAEPDGLSRNAYMGNLGEFLEELFTEAKQSEAAEEMRKVFWWGNLQFSEDQMTQLMHGTREGLKNIAAKTWTKESLTKLVNKTFRNVTDDVGLASWDEILDFLQTVQEEIEDVTEGRQELIGMCGVRSVISVATDF